jgi:hypothetical protein
MDGYGKPDTRMAQRHDRSTGTTTREGSGGREEKGLGWEDRSKNESVKER